MKQTLTLGLIALGLTACAVPGRGLLGPSPQQPSVATVDATKAEFARVPLVTIAAGSTAADYLSTLTGAVQAAEARKPDVIFDVIATVPQTGTPLGQITAAKALTPQASAVAQTIMGAGVPASRVSLGALVLSGIPGEQIRVYVR